MSALAPSRCTEHKPRVGFDPLWAPIIGHYRDGRLDRARIAAHVASLAPALQQFLIGGTTGDGWQIGEGVLDEWLDLVADPAVLTPEHTVLFGAFAADAAGVIARARRIEAAIERAPPVCRFAGITLCAPVDAEATPATIEAHLRAVIEATSSPIAIYQLPQVTQNLIPTDVLARLVRDTGRIVLFKDTSGEDAIARAGVPLPGVRLLRGAEGGYAEALLPDGPYDGWLLSTGNGFAPELRAIADGVTAGRADASDRSAKLSALVKALFDAAAPHGANAFADVARAVDHARAHGRDAARAPLPERFDATTLSPLLIERTIDLLDEAGLGSVAGYLG